MNLLLLNLSLALIWVVLTATLTPLNFLAGFALGNIICWLISLHSGRRNYFFRERKLVVLGFVFLWQFLVSNFRIIYDILTPTHHMNPGILALPLDCKTDEQKVILANLITLTPGTLSLNISPDGKILYIHAMYIRDNGDPEHVVREIKSTFERLVMEIF